MTMLCRTLLSGCLALLLVACSHHPAPTAATGNTAANTQQEPPLYEVLARANAAGQEPLYNSDRPVLQRSDEGVDADPEPLANWERSGRYRATGTASWLAHDLDGRRTASGEVMSSRKFTAAHRSLPLGSYVRVTNLSNGRQVIVKINDRGPFNRHLLIDVSHAAAAEIGMARSGTAKVRLETVSPALARAQAKPEPELAASTRSHAKNAVDDTPVVGGKKLQVLSGSHKEKLVAQGKQLQKQLHVPYYVVSNGQWHRLVLGPVPTKQQQMMMKKVKKLGYRQAYFIS